MSTNTAEIIVLDRKKSELITLAPNAILHMPTSGPSGEPGCTRHPILCERFHPAHPNGCMKGAECNRVHAIVRGAPRKAVHINWAWRSVEECQYERFPAGMQIRIREPVSAKSDIVDTVDSTYVLKTRCVFNDPNRPPTHCAHFYYGRECHCGSECDFAHVVYINAAAEKLERAPPPCAFGRRKKTASSDNIASQDDLSVRVRIGFPFPSTAQQQQTPPFPQQPMVQHIELPRRHSISSLCTPPPSARNYNDASSPMTPPNNYLDTTNTLERHRMRRNCSNTTLAPTCSTPTPVPTQPSVGSTSHDFSVNMSDSSNMMTTYTMATSSTPRRWRYDPYNAVTGRSTSPSCSGGDSSTDDEIAVIGKRSFHLECVSGGENNRSGSDITAVLPTFPSALCSYMMTGEVSTSQ